MADIELEAAFIKETDTWEVCIPDTEPDGKDPAAYVAWLMRKQVRDTAAKDSAELLRTMQQQAWNLR